MARPIVLGNGELHVGINKYGLVHDFYYPYVGLENHSAGKNLRHMVGVWIDGHMSWLTDSAWKIEFSYPHDALVGHIRAVNKHMGVILEFDDGVVTDMSALIRSVHVINMHDVGREIRLFMHQAFVISDTRSNTDTGQYLPDNNAILHYRGKRAFVVSGRVGKKTFDQYTIGLFGIEGREGTHRDAEDGVLESCNVEQGRVDSTIGFTLQIPANDSKRVEYWIACGKSIREALFVHRHIQETDTNQMIECIAEYWHQWLTPAYKIADQLEYERRNHFLRSLLIIKAHTDKRGAIIASSDSAMLNYMRDNYSYMWPRDGAYALWPLIRLGYVDEPYRFFEFCRRGMHPRGYLAHKYMANGSIGSSWHPYAHAAGEVAPPIQEDETALVVFMFSQFYQIQQDKKLLQDFYDTMIKPMSGWMCEYVDETTHLPRATYDLWEEKHLTTTYTTAVVYAALLAASELASVVGETDNARKWARCAERIKEAVAAQLAKSQREAFCKGIHLRSGDDSKHDITLDLSSFYGVFMFGLLPAGAPELQSTLTTMERVFNGGDPLTLAPRYENDAYFRVPGETIGNPWTITSLWMAQYYLEVDRRDDAIAVLEAVEGCMLPGTSVLPEQINRFTGEPLSAAPLVWAHAEYAATLMDMITMQPEGGNHADS